MKTIDVLHLPNSLWLGRKGEQNFRPIAFEWGAWKSEYLNAILSVIYTAPNSDTPLVVATGTNSPVIWQPTTDVSTVSGYGALECHLLDGDNVVGISAEVTTIIDDSASSATQTPPSWVDQVVREVAEAAGHYPKIENGYWFVWDVENEEWSDTGILASGVDGSDGADGHSPYIGTNGHWFVYDDVHGSWSDTGVSASVDETVIANAVAAYLEEHPITVTETDPTVPNWAKQPTKPTYTASEVGALPANTPIPAAVTEQTVSGWGFTKNTGTYSKPSGGIPKTDLASDVQTSLGKADTALQQHQSLSGYATETWVGQQIAAIPDELPVVTSADNGKSLVVGNGVWGKGYQAARIPRVAMTASDTTPSLDPNKLYVFPEMATLTPTLATPSDNTIVNEYHFAFDSGSTATVLTIPATVLQPDGFTVEANMHYEVSILEGAMTAQGWAVTST